MSALVIENLQNAQIARGVALSAEFKEGQLHAVIGPSGSGKSTLFRVLLGAVSDAVWGSVGSPETQGKISRSGSLLYESVSETFIPTWQRDMAIAPQHDVLIGGIAGSGFASAKWQISLGRLSRRARKRSTLSIVQIEEGLQLGSFLNKPVARLSGGQRARVALARALISSPKCLLVDESLSRVERELRVKILEFLAGFAKTQGAVVLIATHDKDTESFCDTVLNLQLPQRENCL